MTALKEEEVSLGKDRMQIILVETIDIVEGLDQV